MPSRRRPNPLLPVAAALERNDMAMLGIDRTTRIGRAYNGRRWGALLHRRRESLDEHLELLDAAATDRPLRMNDGWALDGSRSLPHLEALLEQMGGVIEERGGQHWEEFRKAFLQNILPEDASERYPAILDFATSPEVVSPISRQAGFVPHLSGNLPRGARLMESSTKFDPSPDTWRRSQLWHMDFHSLPTIYVIVALRDIAPEDGPLHFLGAAASRRAAEALPYGERGSPYRVTDERMYSVVDPSEVQRFVGPAGSVLLIDSSRCFHFGSRKPAHPRYHMQYAYVSPVRNDFTGLLREQRDYPVGPEDPPHRRLVLQREPTG